MLIWLLEKYKYDYTEEQVNTILHLISTYHPLFVKMSNPHLKVKIDNSLQKFLAEQDQRFTHLKLVEKYQYLLFNKSDQEAKEQLVDQIKTNKEKGKEAAKKPKEKPAPPVGDFPDKIGDYFKQMLERFSNATVEEFKTLDKEIGDTIHAYYKEQIFDG